MPEVHNTYSKKSRLFIKWVGRAQSEPNFTWNKVTPHYLIHYILRGFGEFHAAGTCHVMGPGSAFCVFPGAKYVMRARARHPWLHTWIAFAGPHADELIAESPFTPEVPVAHGPYSPEIASLFERLYACIEKRNEGYRLQAEGFLYLLVSRLRRLSWRHTASDGPASPPRRRRKSPEQYADDAKRYIAAHLDEQIRSSDVARRLGLNRCYFSRVFSQVTGTSFRDYYLQERMRKAKELLENTDFSLKEIAAYVGYTDYFAFSRRFKKSTGASPSEM